MLVLLLACDGDTYIVEGTVLEVGAHDVHLRHKPIAGLSEAGDAWFQVPDDRALVELEPGDRLYARMKVDEQGTRIVKLRENGRDVLPPEYQPDTPVLLGTVTKVDGGRALVDHEPVGDMAAMLMWFEVDAPVAVGDRIEARLVEGRLLRTRVVGHADLEIDAMAVAPMGLGDVLPAFEVLAEDGSTLRLGEGQGVPTLLTFVFTRCPDPNLCPAIVTHLGALQDRMKGGRLLAVTLDPEHDTPEVLAAYAEAHGADKTKWRFGRLPPDDLAALAGRSGLVVTRDGERIQHGLRFLVLNAEGRLTARHDDLNFSMDRVVEDLGS